MIGPNEPEAVILRAIRRLEETWDGAVSTHVVLRPDNVEHYCDYYPGELDSYNRFYGTRLMALSPREMWEVVRRVVTEQGGRAEWATCNNARSGATEPRNRIRLRGVMRLVDADTIEVVFEEPLAGAKTRDSERGRS